MFAKYLVRFDDICPTMNWGVWNRIEELLVRYEIRPILAVVPDNQDAVLQVDPAEGRFWDHVRRWQARGWTIGLHGYQHRLVTSVPAIAAPNGCSEFAGLPTEQQKTKLRRALDIFARENVVADVWIAPAHSFDAKTVAALRNFGIKVICDGFFLWPHTDNLGVFWIPQQLWGFRPRPTGVWTVCYHLNAWGPAEISTFEQNLERYHRAILNVDAIRDRYASRQKGLVDRVFPGVYHCVRMLTTRA